MQVVTGLEMRQAEEDLKKKLGVSALLLMENAGSRIVEVLALKYGPLQSKRVHILAGMGNNGGDGLVVARQLLQRGARPKVYLFGDVSKSTYEHKTNLEILKKLGIDLLYVEGKQLTKLRFSLNLADLIIDAVFGTGFKGSLSNELKALVDLVNGLNCPVVCIDIPSGVNAANGQVATTAFLAELTINLGMLKAGCLLYPGRQYAGKNVLVDLGFPLESQTTCFSFGEEVLQKLPTRQPWGHKGTFGHTLVVGGSRNYVGAPALCAQAVLRGGGGVASVAVPEGIAGRFGPDELIVVPVLEDIDGSLGEASLPQLRQLLDQKDVLVLGPGLGSRSTTERLVHNLLEIWNGPTVIDADALLALTDDFLQSIPVKKRERWIITPHPGEMAGLIHSDAATVNQKRLQVGKLFAEKWGTIVVLKGAPTIITDGKTVFLNSTGNHGLATAGTGDVLAGLIGALLSQGLQPLQAGMIGVYVHGAAGDRAARDGVRGLVASDCLRKIPEVLS